MQLHLGQGRLAAPEARDEAREVLLQRRVGAEDGEDGAHGDDGLVEALLGERGLGVLDAVEQLPVDERGDDVDDAGAEHGADDANDEADLLLGALGGDAADAREQERRERGGGALREQRLRGVGCLRMFGGVRKGGAREGYVETRRLGCAVLHCDVAKTTNE